MALSVTVDSEASDGTDFKITITKTGSTTAKITLTTTQSGVAHTDNYDVFGVLANATTLTCTATVLWFHPSLTCAIDDNRPPGAATVDITVANAPAHNGITQYQISAGDSTKLKQFIASAAFPALNAGV